MSDYEMINQKVSLQKAARRKDAFKRLTVTLALVLVALLVLLGLEYIGFISEVFLAILGELAIGVGLFKAGYIWRDVRW